MVLGGNLTSNMKKSRHYGSLKVYNTSTTDSKDRKIAEMPDKEFEVYFLHAQLLQKVFKQKTKL
jgi:hypothetical protein